jgi:thioesterase domain-containing protein
LSSRDVNHELRVSLEQVTLRAEARQTFDFPATADDAPRSERLSTGAKHPSVIAIPSIAALSGTHQYLGFARYLRSIREMFALTIPGFVAGERLPANIDAAVQVEASVVRKCMKDNPAVLVGMSAGGTLAYGVARHLEEVEGPVIAGVVLLDAYPFGRDRDETLAYSLLRRMFEESGMRRYLTETRLTAMAWYIKLFTDWEVSEVAAPTLMVRPSEPMLGMPTEAEWRAQWPYPHDSVEVPGDHWTMMMEGATVTAEAVEQWISRVASERVNR